MLPMSEGQGAEDAPWVVRVGPDRIHRGTGHRYLAFDDDGAITVRIVLSEYLTCEVVWDAED